MDKGLFWVGKGSPALTELASVTSRVQLSATPWSVAHQAPLSMGFSRQEYWSGLPFPSHGAYEPISASTIVAVKCSAGETGHACDIAARRLWCLQRGRAVFTESKGHRHEREEFLPSFCEEHRISALRGRTDTCVRSRGHRVNFILGSSWFNSGPA